jgi:hypothetical protein
MSWTRTCRASTSGPGSEYIRPGLGNDFNVLEFAELLAERGRHGRPETGLLVFAQRELVLLAVRRAERQFELFHHQLRVVGKRDARAKERGFEVPGRYLLETLDIDLTRRLRLGRLRAAAACGGRNENQETETDR